MKRLFYIIGLLILYYAAFWPFIANGQPPECPKNLIALNPALLGNVASQGACDISRFSVYSGATASYLISQEADKLYWSTEFVYTGPSVNICAANTWGYFVGSNPHTYYLKLFDNNAGDPGNLLGTSTGQDLSGIGGDADNIVETGWVFPSSIPLVHGTNYHIAMYGLFDDDDYYRWTYKIDTTNNVNYDDDGSGVWMNQSTFVSLMFELLSK